MCNSTDDMSSLVSQLRHCRRSTRRIGVPGRLPVVGVVLLVVVLAGCLGALAGLGTPAAARIGTRRGLLRIPLARFLGFHGREPSATFTVSSVRDWPLPR